jgi:hypothetical protein
MSYADRLRAQLLRAGVTRHELHHATPTSLPVDFHSTRRAYVSALARAGVNQQTAMILSGHSDAKVHQHYVEAATIRALPPAAMPIICIADAGTLLGDAAPSNDSSVFSGAGNGDRTRDPKLGKLDPAEYV